ncbi:MAG TPA: hypothetical protein VMW71_07270 [Thermoplasmata archaeon]|nr:hypothetical protein [Thermoplasmata archaeon]
MAIRTRTEGLAMKEERLTVSVELELEEIIQIEQVLLRHKRTPVILGLMEKMLEAKITLHAKKDDE